MFSFRAAHAKAALPKVRLRFADIFLVCCTLPPRMVGFLLAFNLQKGVVQSKDAKGKRAIPPRQSCQLVDASVLLIRSLQAEPLERDVSEGLHERRLDMGGV